MGFPKIGQNLTAAGVAKALGALAAVVATAVTATVLTIGSHLDLTEVAQPGAPQAGTVRVYAAGDGQLYRMDSGGTAAQVVSGSATYSQLAPAATASLQRKNLLINGNFNVWQRGTSFNAAPMNRIYTADRWAILQNGFGTGTTVSQQGAGIVGSNYCARLQRNNASTDTDELQLSQQVEGVNYVQSGRGVPLTVSFYARGGTDFSSTNHILTCVVQTGTGTDEAAFTGSVDVATQNFYLAPAMTKYAVTTPPTAANTGELRVVFKYTPTGTAGAADYFDLTQVQLEPSTAATNFEYVDAAAELARCQRYYFRTMYGDGGGTYSVDLMQYATGGVSVNSLIVLPVRMRANGTGAKFGTWLTANATAATIGIYPRAAQFVNIGWVAAGAGASEVWNGNAGSGFEVNAEL